MGDASIKRVGFCPFDSPTSSPWRVCFPDRFRRPLLKLFEGNATRASLRLGRASMRRLNVVLTCIDLAAEFCRL